MKQECIVGFEPIITEKYWYCMCMEESEWGHCFGPFLSEFGARFEGGEPDENGITASCGKRHIVFNGVIGAVRISEPCYWDWTVAEWELFEILRIEHNRRLDAAKIRGIEKMKETMSGHSE